MTQVGASGKTGLAATGCSNYCSSFSSSFSVLSLLIIMNTTSEGFGWVCGQWTNCMMDDPIDSDVAGIGVSCPVV
jgi:hypothetical protein